MLIFSYKILGYATLAVWVILTCFMIYWLFNMQKIGRLNNFKEDIEKKKKYEKILKVLNYVLCFFIFTMVISSLDILFMTIGIINHSRLPYKGIILASDVSGYLLILFFRYMFKSILNYADN